MARKVAGMAVLQRFPADLERKSIDNVHIHDYAVRTQVVKEYQQVY